MARESVPVGMHCRAEGAAFLAPGVGGGDSKAKGAWRGEFGTGEDAAGRIGVERFRAVGTGRQDALFEKEPLFSVR